MSLPAPPQLRAARRRRSVLGSKIKADSSGRGRVTTPTGRRWWSRLPEGSRVDTGYYSCALTSEGVIWCWGYNEHARIGDGTWIDRLEPQRVRALLARRQAAIGERRL